MKSNLIDELKASIANGDISLSGAIRVLESEASSGKPHIKLIDRRKQYEQRKLNFIARMNQYVNLYLGLTISNIRDAIEVSRMMRQCTADDYYLGLSRIKVNQGRESR